MRGDSYFLKKRKGRTLQGALSKLVREVEGQFPEGWLYLGKSFLTSERLEGEAVYWEEQSCDRLLRKKKMQPLKELEESDSGSPNWKDLTQYIWI